MRTKLGWGIGLLLLAVIGFGYSPDLPAAEVDALYTNAASQFVTLKNGARVHVRDEGQRLAPALVLLHGSNDSLHTWEPWVKQLSNDFRLLSLDFPAHGLTGRVPDGDYTDAAYVRTVQGVAEKLGLDRFAVAGNSMGGKIAWEYTLAHPERVSKLILLDASGYPDNHPPPRFAQLLALPGMSFISRWGNPRSLVESGYHQAVADDAVITQSDIDRSIALVRRAGTREALRARRLFGQRTGPVERLGEIHVPALILWGDHDEFVSPENAPKFAHDIAGSRMIVYAGVGHMPMREVPERSAADARAFLLEPTAQPQAAQAAVVPVR